MLDMNQKNQDEVMSRWGMTSQGDEMVEIGKQQRVLMWQQMRQDGMRWEVLAFGSKEENKAKMIRREVNAWCDGVEKSSEYSVMHQGIWDETDWDIWDEVKIII